MERCPACQARLKDTEICPRCKADLTAIINSEQVAKTLLAKAIQYLSDQQIERSIIELEQSLKQKNSPLALLFHDFLIQQQARKILQLLKQRKLLAAKTQLFSIRRLLPYSLQLQRLQGFTDYLLIKFINRV